jgi:hypothetical protein
LRRLSFGKIKRGRTRADDEIHDNIVRMQREWEAQRDALATVRRFNARLSAKGSAWFWPKITAALVSKHHWLVIACDSCGTVVDLDLRVKPRRRGGLDVSKIAGGQVDLGGVRT